MTDEVKLLPCPVPWCDGEGEAVWYAVGKQDHPYWVKCMSCGCKTPSQYATVAEAIAAWNTRAIEATRPTDEVVERMWPVLQAICSEHFDAPNRFRVDWPEITRNFLTAIAAMKDAASG